MENKQWDGGCDSKNRRCTRRFPSDIFTFSDSDSSNPRNTGTPNLATNYSNSTQKTPDVCKKLRNMNPEQVRQLLEKMNLSETKPSSQDDGEESAKSANNANHLTKINDKENQESSIENSSNSKENKENMIKMKRRSQRVQSKTHTFLTPDGGIQSSKQETSDINLQHTDTDCAQTIFMSKCSTYETKQNFVETDDQDAKRGGKKNAMKTVRQNCEESGRKVQEGNTETKLQSVINNSKTTANRKTANEFKKDKLTPLAIKSMEVVDSPVETTTKNLMQRDQATHANTTRRNTGKKYKQHSRKPLTTREIIAISFARKMNEDKLSETTDSQTPHLKNKLVSGTSKPESLEPANTPAAQVKNKSKSVQQNKSLQLHVNEKLETISTECIPKTACGGGESIKISKFKETKGISKSSDDKIHETKAEKVYKINPEDLGIPRRVTRSTKKDIV